MRNIPSQRTLDSPLPVNAPLTPPGPSGGVPPCLQRAPAPPSQFSSLLRPTSLSPGTAVLCHFAPVALQTGPSHRRIVHSD